MTELDATTPAPAIRRSRPRHYLMCPPTYFSVKYAINPWMNPELPVDHQLAVQQWNTLHQTFVELGHTVDTITPDPDLPDMVFAANGGLVVDGKAFGARFRFPQRQAESQLYRNWFKGAEIDATESIETNEGEGDFLTLASMILAGSGFRTNISAHVEAAKTIDRPIVSLELVDPRFYHLDVCLAVLDDGTGSGQPDIAYFPGAFTVHSRRTLRELFPDALICSEDDASALGLNLVSDGHKVVMPTQATDLIDQVRDRGYDPVTVDLGEFLKSGGGVKCCTMELHR